MQRSILAAAAFWLATTPATAKPQSCTTIANASARLTCFDSFFPKQTNAAPQTQTAKPEAKPKAVKEHTNKGTWITSIDQSALTDTKSVFIIQSARDSYIGTYNRTHRPTLILRCLDSTTSLYINGDDDYLTDHRLTPTPVFRIDKQKAQEVRLRASTDNKALGLWSGSTSIPWIKRLIGAEMLLVQWVPVSDSPQTFSFDLTGLSEAIKPLRTTCNW